MRYSARTEHFVFSSNVCCKPHNGMGKLICASLSRNRSNDKVKKINYASRYAIHSYISLICINLIKLLSHTIFPLQITSKFILSINCVFIMFQFQTVQHRAVKFKPHKTQLATFSLRPENWRRSLLTYLNLMLYISHQFQRHSLFDATPASCAKT